MIGQPLLRSLHLIQGVWYSAVSKNLVFCRPPHADEYANDLTENYRTAGNPGAEEAGEPAAYGMSITGLPILKVCQ